MTPLAHLIALPIRAYRLIGSPWVGHNCRFQPTCSAYALEALELHGGIKGLILTIRRVGRCHPWGEIGYDPVPGSAADQPPGCGCGCGAAPAKGQNAAPEQATNQAPDQAPEQAPDQARPD